jgi:hypothetical protein
MSNSHDDAVAAFLARGGQITKAAEGESLGLTAREWHAKARDPKVVRDLGPAKAAKPVKRNWKLQAEYDEKWGTINGYAPWQYNREM